MLTTLVKIKTRLGIAEADVVNDAMLTNYILSTSARFENECKRIFGRGADITEEFAADETEIRVGRYPIEEDGVSTFELKSSESEGWIEETVVDFIIRRNCVISLNSPIGTSRQQARVTYTGGYVLPGTTPTAGQTALPDDLEQSCVEQVAYWYQNRNRLGLVGVSGDGGSVQQFAQLDLLPTVKAVLKFYERWMN